MASRKDQPSKKPTGSKPQHRLFSFDSGTSRRSGSEPSVDDAMQNAHSRGLQTVDEDPGLHYWTGEDLYQSPEGSPQSERPEFIHSKSSSHSSNLSIPFARRPGPTSASILQPSDNPAPSSASTARWANLRDHVLPASSHSAAPSQSSTVPRPTTPKPSRLARLGFRQVVEHASAQVASSMSATSRKFSQDIVQACHAARYPSSSKPIKSEGTAFLPFMTQNSSTATLSSGQPTPRNLNPRRPVSQQSLATLASKPSVTKPTLQHLYTALLLHSQSQANADLTHNRNQSLAKHALPHEPLVLSVLLSPFLDQTLDGTASANEEKWFSTESFGVIVRTWHALTPETSLARIVHLIKSSLPLSSAPSHPKLFSLLSTVLLSPSIQYSPAQLRTIFEGLFMLYSSFFSYNSVSLIRETIDQLRYGEEGGDLAVSRLEAEYGVSWTSEDDILDIRDGILGEAIGKCLVNAEGERAKVMLRCVEEYWPVCEPDRQYIPTPLLNAINTRKINTCTKAFLHIFSSPSSFTSEPSDVPAFTSFTSPLATELAQTITNILHTHVIPSTHSSPAAIPGLVRIVLQLLCIQSTSTWAASEIVLWRSGGGPNSEWKEGVDEAIRKLIKEEPWNQSIPVLQALMNALEEYEAEAGSKKGVVGFFMPVLYETLALSPPSYPHASLTKLLQTISYRHPQAFFKPLFGLAAAGSVGAAAACLRRILGLGRYVPDWWRRDAEMMSVALMSDAAKASARGKEKEGQRRWGLARLGQGVLIVELIMRIRHVRLERESGVDKRGWNRNEKVDNESNMKEDGQEMEKTFIETAKFISALEGRLGILLDAKEKHTLIPPSQRRLFCVLFLEMRLLTRSLQSTTFLSLIVTWFLEQHIHQQINHPVDMENYSELRESTESLKEVYEIVCELGPNHRQSSVLFPNLMASSTSPLKSSVSTTAQIQFVLSLSMSEGIAPQFLELFVALSALLTLEDYKKMGKWLWSTCLDGDTTRIIAPACFLLMQCAEKAEKEFLKIVQHDLMASDVTLKLLAIGRISTLSNWRFQLLSQPIIVDRSHRRPFKLTRGPLPFVATDIGSPLYVREADSSPFPIHLYQAKPKDATNASDKTNNPSEIKNTNTNMPLELRKRLAEIGWAQEEMVLDERVEWILTPMSLLPVYQMDRAEGSVDPGLPSPAKKPPGDAGDGTPGLLRRKSSTTGGPLYGMKRRAVFVPALATIFPLLASLVFDPQFAVASAARNTVIDLMRNDPALITRPVFDLLSGDHEDIGSAISTLRAFLHVRRVLPPVMAHHVFNNLAGFLKFAARQVEGIDTLKGFAHTIPILAKLVSQVSDMSIREIRRAKVEVFLIPSGSLWFSSATPSGPMFPRHLETSENPFEPLPPSLVRITMIRLAQNMTFLAMLKRKPQDVQMIRKSMSRLVLPSRHAFESTPLDLKDYIPRMDITERVNPLTFDAGLRGLSLMLSRSYLLLIAQVFRSISRHLNDRNELAVLVDGLNRILLAHGDDIGIVSQAMIALMVASTRFRRLFTSGGGYTLFMPAVIKVYTEFEAHSGIKHAIEYTVNRFYALHREAFIFQTLDIMAHIMAIPEIEGDWVAKSVYTLFSALRRGISPITPDAAGIHNSNKGQEREALMVITAEEKPQTFLASLRPSPSGHDYPAVDLPEEYESERLGIDDFVRLFLTVIAHDPTILRAEQFLRFFRFLAPYLYHSSSSARVILRDGIDALGVVLTRVAVKVKGPDTGVLNSVKEDGVNAFSTEAILENQLLDKSKSSSDISMMRLDYLHLIVAFTGAGGRLARETSQRTNDLIKTMLRDSTAENSQKISSFFQAYTRNILTRDSRASVKEVVTFLGDVAPLVSAYSAALDFSGVFETVSALAVDPLYANDPIFSRLIVTQLCASGLAACELAASEKMLLTLPLRPNLVTLLANAVFLRGSDMMSEIEKHEPSHQFLTGIILPLVMSLKTTADIVSEGTWTEPWHRTTLSRTWVRLLSYAISACHKRECATDSTPIPERTKSNDKRRSATTDKGYMTTVVTALQIIKAIVVRAEDDLSYCLPGVWSRIGSLLKSLLAEGDGSFTYTPQDHSPAPSPIQSPRTSTSFLEQSSPSSGFLAGLRSTTFRMHGQHTSYPRMVDYSMWSLFELLCLTRNALMIQMRIFMQEKVATLDQELRCQTNPGARSRDPRISSSLFSKPRRRTSAMSPSEPASPRISASPSFPTHFSSLASRDSITRQAGYQSFAQSPANAQGPQGPKIIHLGPVRQLSPVDFRTSSSSGVGGDPRGMAHSPRIKSLSLVRTTYYRIRLVLTCMGYEPSLLPTFGGEPGVDLDMMVWTKKQALAAVVKETKQLVEEFAEAIRDDDEDLVLVSPDQSMAI